MSAVLTFSDPTIGRLADLAPRVSKERLKILLRHADLWRFAPQSSSGNSSKPALLMESLDQANLAADAGDATAHQSLLDFVQALIDELRPLLSGLTTQIAALAEALRADGYELQVPAGLYDAARLLPTEPSAAPLPPEITALEAEFQQRGYHVALNHYQQAVTNLLDQHYEAANGQLRSALEDLVTHLAEDHAGYQRPAKASTGGNAITHLVQNGHIPGQEGGAMLQGLWQILHTNGSHPGSTSAEEARERLLIVTATARLLLRRLPAQA